MNSRRRHITKTITWRITASLATFVLTWFFFQGVPDVTSKAVWVAILESTSKMVLYYYHERIWYLRKVKFRSSVRHLFKTITWRLIASLITFIIAFLIFSEDHQVMEKATSVATVEIFLKMLLYYIHERIWYHQKMGLGGRKEKS